MTKNPVYNALAASAYIVLVAWVMNTGTRLFPHTNSFLAPVAVLSLFTLSAALMGYLFCYEPGQLYFNGKKKQAVTLFLQTVLAFGFLTMVALVLLFSGVIR